MQAEFKLNGRKWTAVVTINESNTKFGVKVTTEDKPWPSKKEYRAAVIQAGYLLKDKEECP